MTDWHLNSHKVQKHNVWHTDYDYDYNDFDWKKNQRTTTFFIYDIWSYKPTHSIHTHTHTWQTERIEQKAHSFYRATSLLISRVTVQ